MDRPIRDRNVPTAGGRAGVQDQPSWWCQVAMRGRRYRRTYNVRANVLAPVVRWPRRRILDLHNCATAVVIIIIIIVIVTVMLAGRTAALTACLMVGSATPLGTLHTCYRAEHKHT